MKKAENSEKHPEIWKRVFSCMKNQDGASLMAALLFLIVVLIFSLYCYDACSITLILSCFCFNASLTCCLISVSRKALVYCLMILKANETVYWFC